MLNTVKRAVEVWTVLQRDKTLRSAGTDVRLIHSRFRPAERRAWREGFLSGQACAPDTNRITLPATALDLSPSEAGLSPRTGRSWTERVLDLVERLGPFTLAWLEALLRAADQRASSLTIADKLLQGPENDDAGHPMDGSRRPLAQPVAGGTPTPPPGGDSPPRRQLDGDGGRAGERGVDSGTTRPPHSATRYIETSVGILSYQELAPLLAERVADAELAISDRRFADLPLHNLVLELHRRVCVDLTPEMVGRWRLRDVRVGDHQAPPYWQVPCSCAATPPISMRDWPGWTTSPANGSSMT